MHFIFFCGFSKLAKKSAKYLGTLYQTYFQQNKCIKAKLPNLVSWTIVEKGKETSITIS